ncbi:chorismate synthase, partial [archaeon]|nr:chorismate synthase [archaeon]NDB56085.1 chorismate synthase [archaeon]NDB79955.1 chorismate synthase [archaeon]
MNSFGKNYRITLIGSSHGNLVGVIIDGAPIGYEISTEQIKIELKKRRPNQSEI